MGFVVVEDRRVVSIGIVCVKGVSARVRRQVIKLRRVVVRAATECKKSDHDVTAVNQSVCRYQVPASALCHSPANMSTVNPLIAY